MRRLLATTIAVVCAAALIAVGVAPAAPASASASVAVADLTCAGSQTVLYSPGLTLVPTTQDISVTTTYGGCLSITNPDVVSGQSHVSTTVGSRTCLTPLETDTISVTITWNTGATSTFTATRTVTDLAATILVTYTGTVTSGLFAGALLVQTIVYPSIVAITCAISPVTSRTGVTAAEFTSI